MTSTNDYSFILLSERAAKGFSQLLPRGSSDLSWRSREKTRVIGFQSTAAVLVTLQVLKLKPNSVFTPAAAPSVARTYLFDDIPLLPSRRDTVCAKLMLFPIGKASLLHLSYH